MSPSDLLAMAAEAIEIARRKTTVLRANDDKLKGVFDVGESFLKELEKLR